MVNQNYRAIRDSQEAHAEKRKQIIADAINNGLYTYKDEHGNPRWKNPLTEKDEPYNVNKIIEKYDLDFSWFAQTKKQKQKNAVRREHVKDYLKRKENNAKRIDDDHGRFVFLIWDTSVYNSHSRLAPEILPENFTRLMLLACCLKWGEQYIMRTNDILDFARKLCSTRARKCDIRKILGLTCGTFDRFWADVTTHGYLSGDEENGYQLSTIFRRGPLKGVCAQRVYMVHFLLWYYQDYAAESRTVNVKDHRRMGKILSLTPYLHYQNNILCRNPWNKNEDELKPLTGPAIAQILGNNPDNWKRDLNDLQKLTFFWNGTEQFFFAENTECSSAVHGYYLNAIITFFGDADNYALLQTKPFFYKHPHMIPNSDAEFSELSYTVEFFPDDNDVFTTAYATYSNLSNTNIHRNDIYI